MSGLVVDIVDLPRAAGSVKNLQIRTPAPADLGTEVIGVPEGSDLALDVTLTSMDDGVLAQADADLHVHGECVRCLARLTPEFSATVNQVFSASDDFIVGADDDDQDKGSGDEIMAVVDDTVDLEQAFIDEMGMTLPFNPVCEPECDGDTEVPDPDGVSGEENNLVDPRWAGLEKFL